MPGDSPVPSCDSRPTAPLARQTLPTPLIESRKKNSHGHGRASGDAGTLEWDPARAEWLESYDLPFDVRVMK